MSKGKKINWLGLKSKFIKFKGNLTEFKEKYSLSNRFYLMAREYKFVEDREKVVQAAYNKTEESAANVWKDRWDYKTALLDKYDKKAEKFLKDGVQKRDWKSGEVVTHPLEPTHLNELSSITDRTLKGHKLIAGEKTGEETQVNVLNQIANFIEKEERENGWT